MNFNIRLLRWIAWPGLAIVLLQSLYTSFPFKPRQEYGLILMVILFAAAAVVSLVLMPRALWTLLGRIDLLAPLALLTFLSKLLGWLANAPVLKAIFLPTMPLHLLNAGFALSLYSFSTILLEVAYAAWMTCVVLELVRSEQSDPCASIPLAGRRFLRVFGIEFIGWAVILLGTGSVLFLMPLMGWFALVPMAIGAVFWNFATAALLPVAVQSEEGFKAAFGAGIRASFAHLSKWRLLIIAHMLLLGVVNFFYARWSEGNSHHNNINWNVNAFWTGGFADECHWYAKMVAAYKTSRLPIVDALLGLLFGAMAVAVKIAIVQRMQPPAPPILDESDDPLPPFEQPPFVNPSQP